MVLWQRGTPSGSCRTVAGKGTGGRCPDVCPGPSVAGVAGRSRRRRRRNIGTVDGASCVGDEPADGGGDLVRGADALGGGAGGRL
ncbi:hypothetical protein GCM10010145_49050 [Streptomyces ruber]|uniref:Uncharacterized protein n=2 Tax=Streptomyces TaxID=1883 RepID=A0A918EWT7_9ACTN|nr:hypothetical protein GCM10010145_49050 [Streptomyces ruber]